MERSKQMYLSHFRSQSKSLERATADRIMQVCVWGRPVVDLIIL